MSKLKVGIIGVGNIARFHMPGWAKSEHAEVVAAADVNEKVLKNWGEKNNINNILSSCQFVLPIIFCSKQEILDQLNDVDKKVMTSATHKQSIPEYANFSNYKELNFGLVF